ncbi:unnamed protein product, partial [Symbiodinium sp. CCMP2456]
KTVQVTYEEGMTVGSEIAGFRFDVSDPLAPFTVTGFSKKGPAQTAGVMVGWFLDVGALLREEQFISLEGEDFGPLPTTLADVAQNMEGFQKRLEALRGCSEVTLTFMNGLDFQLLPQCRVKYEEEVGSEISGLTEKGGVVTIDGFSNAGGEGG